MGSKTGIANTEENGAVVIEMKDQSTNINEDDDADDGESFKKSTSFVVAEGQGGDKKSDSAMKRKLRNMAMKREKGYQKNKRVIWRVIYLILALAYFAYFIYVCWYDIMGALALVVMTACVVVYLIYAFIRDHYGDSISDDICEPCGIAFQRSWFVLKWFVYLGLVAVVIIILYIYTTPPKYEQLISAFGMVVFILISILLSKHPFDIKWRPVIWGLSLQILCGLFILTNQYGRGAFEWLADQIITLQNYSNYGSEFLFGENYLDHQFAFQVLPIIIFYTAIVSILYYYGVMQFLISKLAWILQVTMKTSAPESLNAAANIFIGNLESPVMIRPFLIDMTKSELFAVLTCGFATISGGLIAVYNHIGINISYVLSASLMSAPAALAIAKIMYPETGKCKFKTQEEMDSKIPKVSDTNVIAAASYGAVIGVSLVRAIAVCLMVFVGILAFVNAVFMWIGEMAGFHGLTFEFMCSYLFMPLAWLMGTPWSDCQVVAELIGIRAFVNEIIAFGYMKEIMDGNIDGVSLTPRGEVIATYTLCGFTTISDIGIMVGGLSAMVPQLRDDLSEMAVRALIAGTLANFMTACTAGILWEDVGVSAMNGSIPLNATEVPW